MGYLHATIEGSPRVLSCHTNTSPIFYLGTIYYTPILYLGRCPYTFVFGRIWQNAPYFLGKCYLEWCARFLKNCVSGKACDFFSTFSVTHHLGCFFVHVPKWMVKSTNMSSFLPFLQHPDMKKKFQDALYLYYCSRKFLQSKK